MGQLPRGQSQSQASHSVRVLRDHRRALEVKVGVHIEGYSLPTSQPIAKPGRTFAGAAQVHQHGLALLSSRKGQHDRYLQSRASHALICTQGSC